MSDPRLRDPEVFDAATARLDGTGSVEASAGTGKTFTIARLYLRLIVERGLAVDSILVVTYTVAATEELRGRIRAALAEARSQIARGAIEDELLASLVAESGAATAFARLESAVSGFDEAAIFTIHGFCQRVLAEKAFESGMSFRTELLVDDGELMAEIAADFWRLRLAGASPLFARFLVDAGVSPSSLLAPIRDFVGRPYLRELAPPPPAPADQAEADLDAAFAEARAIWRRDRDAIVAELTVPDRLSKQSYDPEKLPRWLATLDDHLAATPTIAVPEALAKLTSSALKSGTRKHAADTPPSHPFFAAAERIEALAVALAELYEARRKHLRVELLAFCRAEMARRKRRRRVQSYDDLLIDLDEALRREGGHLREALRERYPAALIDEFQDTDPIQYSIFRQIYAGSRLPVFFVGDPKQAIYSFRGADVFAYLDATRDAAQRYRLDHNWRSAAELNRAVNALFAGATRPFLIEEIPFQPTVPAEVERPPLVVEGDPPEPFRIAVLRRAQDAGKSGRPKAITTAQARGRAARATAAEIARLLTLGAAGRARIGDRPLTGGDIAVLVRTNDEARLVRRELLRLRVPSVQQAMQSVFATREAVEIERVLASLAAPGDEPRLKGALVTELLGLTGEDLDRMQQPGGEAEWEERAERMRLAHRTWRDHGFVRAFRELVAREGIARRLLPYPDGDRRLTNLFHLGELLAEAEVRGRLGLESLLRWLADRRRSATSGAEERAEERQLRLESDENLVQIVTVHKSKGLQYGIAFCPFLWSGWVSVLDGRRRDHPFRFHDPESLHASLDLGSDQEEAMRAHAAREEIAEKLRLLYVALTRARHRCVLTWGAIGEAGTSAPAWLLHQRRCGEEQPTPEGVEAAFAAISDAELIADLRALVDRSAGTIGIDEIGEVAAPAPAPPARPIAALRARVPARPVPPGFQVASFSTLIGSGAHDGAADRAREGVSLEVVDAPDHDARAAAPVAAEPAAERTIFSFPRGVRAGRCLHAVFEHLDFASLAAGDAAARRAAIAPLVERQLAAHRLEPAWRDVAIAAIDRAIALPLDAAGEVRLAGLTRDRSVRELEFTYPVGALDAPRLRRVLLDHGVAGGRFDREIAQLGFGRVSGFMKGFVDLVFESGGRFYVLDYKSNHLGERIDDYATERLDAAMARSGYFLQYLIYSLTLHRLLRLRLPGYDPAAHLGGVFYVFLRGLDAARPPGWSVFHDRPAVALVEALDRSIAGDAGDRGSRPGAAP